MFGISKRRICCKLARWEVPIDQVSQASASWMKGAKEYAQRHAAELTDKALKSLAEANPIGPAGEELTQLARRLLGRRC
jgi:geranylgeranyl pyrophosphate synthase